MNTPEPPTSQPDPQADFITTYPIPDTNKWEAQLHTKEGTTVAHFYAETKAKAAAMAAHYRDFPAILTASEVARTKAELERDTANELRDQWERAAFEAGNERDRLAMLARLIQIDYDHAWIGEDELTRVYRVMMHGKITVVLDSLAPSPVAREA